MNKLGQFKKGHIPWIKGKTKKDFPQINNGREENKTILQCPQCKKEFEVRPSIVEKRICCSRECDFLYRDTKVLLNCKYCDKEFLAIPSEIKRGRAFCSKSCSALYRKPWESMGNKRGEDNPNWKGGNPFCIDCGNRVSSINAKRCGDCWKEFLHNQTGENHPRWIKDRSMLKKKQERNDSAYHEWRIQVYKRDNFKCRIDNCDCNGRIEAHHILSWRDYPELRYEVNNGITLCHAHHPRVRAEEEKMIEVFQELVPQI